MDNYGYLNGAQNAANMQQRPRTVLDDFRNLDGMLTRLKELRALRHAEIKNAQTELVEIEKAIAKLERLKETT